MAIQFWLVGFTVAVYGGYLVAYGDTLFDSDSPGFSLDFLQSLGELITLGGSNSALPGTIQAVLIFAVGIPWLIELISAIKDITPGGG